MGLSTMIIFQFFFNYPFPMHKDNIMSLCFPVYNMISFQQPEVHSNINTTQVTPQIITASTISSIKLSSKCKSPSHNQGSHIQSSSVPLFLLSPVPCPYSPPAPWLPACSQMLSSFLALVSSDIILHTIHIYFYIPLS